MQYSRNIMHFPCITPQYSRPCIQSSLFVRCLGSILQHCQSYSTAFLHYLTVFSSVYYSIVLLPYSIVPLLQASSSSKERERLNRTRLVSPPTGSSLWTLAACHASHLRHYSYSYLSQYLRLLHHMLVLLLHLPRTKQLTFLVRPFARPWRQFFCHSILTYRYLFTTYVISQTKSLLIMSGPKTKTRNLETTVRPSMNLVFTPLVHSTPSWMTVFGSHTCWWTQLLQMRHGSLRPSATLPLK